MTTVTVAVTHTKTLVSPSTGTEDKVYGSDYVSPTSHAAVVTGLGSMAEQNANAVAITGGTAKFTGSETVTGSDTQSALIFQSLSLGYDGAAALSVYGGETSKSAAILTVNDQVAGGMLFEGTSDGTVAPFQINGIFTATPSSGISAIQLIAEGPPDSTFGIAAGVLAFSVSNDGLPNVLSIMECNGGAGGSVGALGINTDTPAAFLHIVNRAVAGQTAPYVSISQVIAICDGISGQTGDLHQWKVNGGTLSKVAASGAISVPDEVYGSGWNGSLEVPTKNAVYDKIQTLGSAAYTASSAYDAAGLAAAALVSALAADISLSAPQTWTGIQQFGTIGGAVSKLAIAGATSGKAILDAPAVAGTAVITLPGITSTLATLAANTFTGPQSLPLGSGAAASLVFTGDAAGWYRSGSNQWTWIDSANNPRFALLGSVIRMAGDTPFGWCSGNSTTSQDLLLCRSAAAVLQQGTFNAASPVAQTLQAQGSRAGTDSNVGGANYTWQPGTGTGTGTAASAIISAPTVVASGTGAQTIAEICRFNTTTGVTVKSGVALQLGNAAVTGLAAGVLAATTNATLTITDSAGQVYRVPCII